MLECKIVKLAFEHNYQHKYLEMSFEEPVEINSDDDVLAGDRLGCRV